MAASDDSNNSVGGDVGSSLGGLMGLRDPLLLMSVGAGLMSGARYGSNAGEGLIQGLQLYQQQRLAGQQYGMNQLQMRMMQARMPALQQFYGALPGLFGGSPPQGATAQGAAPAPNAAPSESAPVPDAATAGGNPGVYGPTRLPTQPAATPPPTAMTAPSQGLMGADPYRMLQIGTMGAVAGAPEANALIDAAKTRLQYDPETQTRLAAAKDAVAQDQYLIRQALAQGNEPLARAIYNGKFQEDLGLLKVSSMGGIQTRIDPATGQISTLNPNTGIQTQGNQASLMPGMAPALQQKSAAEALGTAQAELVPMVDPNTHQTYYVPKSALVGGGGGAAAAARQPLASPAQPGAPTAQPSGAMPAAAAPGGARPLAGLSPGQKGFLEERGVESAKYVSALQDAADSATNTNYALGQMVSSAKGVQLGPGAAARTWVETAAAGLGQQFGIDPPKELASYEQLDKYANQIAFAATRQMGSREAAQIVHLQMVSNPNKQLVPEAFSGLVQSMQAMNNYIIAKNTAIQAQSGADNDSALQAASVWTQKIDPRVWDLSLGPELAGKFAGTIGVAKIATAIPVMASEDAVSVIRNLPQTMRSQVLARLPVQAKQEILGAMQQGATIPTARGATGAW